MQFHLYLLFLAIGIPFCVASPVEDQPAPIGLPFVNPAPAPVTPVVHHWTSPQHPYTKKLLLALRQYGLLTYLSWQVSIISKRTALELDQGPHPGSIYENFIIGSSMVAALGAFVFTMCDCRFLSPYQIAGASIALAHLVFLLFWMFFSDSSVGELSKNLLINSDVTFYLPFAGLLMYFLDWYNS